MQHFLNTEDLPFPVYKTLISSAIKLKEELKRRMQSPQTLRNKTFVLLFQKPSTRTRLSFQTGIMQMGGNCIFMTTESSQLSRGEPIRDTARILSSMVQGIIIRSKFHTTITEFARNSSVPVINALSSDYHPCQLLGDMMTFYELRGNIGKKKVVWYGDGNNVCRSYIQAAKVLGFHLTLAIPSSYLPSRSFLNSYSEYVTIIDDPYKAAKNADLVCTDVWISMGDQNPSRKTKELRNYQVTPKLLDLAKEEVLFMHCLPANEGTEISLGLLDDPRSAVWQQAENRLHSQKALLQILFG